MNRDSSIDFTSEKHFLFISYNFCCCFFFNRVERVQKARGVVVGQG